jgi:hypothetical protein
MITLLVNLVFENSIGVEIETQCPSNDPKSVC